MGGVTSQSSFDRRTVIGPDARSHCAKRPAKIGWPSFTKSSSRSNSSLGVLCGDGVARAGPGGGVLRLPGVPPSLSVTSAAAPRGSAARSDSAESSMARAYALRAVRLYRISEPGPAASARRSGFVIRAGSRLVRSRTDVPQVACF